MNITDFLEARIEEDEEQAKNCQFLGWFPGKKYGITAVSYARVLAECSAKRAILREHELDLHMSQPYCDTCAEWWKCELGEGPPPVRYPCPTIEALAAVYKDHPDYQQEWRQTRPRES